MGKEIKYSPELKKVERTLLKKVESNLDYYISQYSAGMIEEFEYLVSEGFYHSIAEPIVDDIIIGGELYKPNVFKRKKAELKAVGAI